MIVARGIPSEEYPTSGIFELDQAQALKAAGMNVSYAVIDLRSIRKRRKIGLIKYTRNGIDVFSYSIPCGPVGCRLLSLAGVYSFRRIFTEICQDKGIPDVIHAHFAIRNGYYAAQGLNGRAIPLVITEHDGDVLNQRLSKIERKYLQRSVDLSSAVICVSDVLKNSIEDMTGKDDIAVIPNAISSEFFYKNRKGSSDRFTFISVSRLYAVKRNKLLIDAFCKSFSQNKQVRLVIIGGGPEEAELRKHIVDLSAQDQIELRGYLKRAMVIQALSQADAFVLASASETFGVVYAEALACGLPVVSTKNGGADSIVNLENGLLTKVDDLHELSAALIKMSNDIDTYNRVKISERAIELYGSSSVAKKLIGVYKSAINCKTSNK